MESSNEKAYKSSHTRNLTELPSAKSGSEDDFVVSWTEKDEKRVRNKLDWQIVSFGQLMYLPPIAKD